MTTLMVQGTTSDAGKSAVVTGLCRWLHRQGIRVAPFKPQNMALNSAVTAQGGEIGRSQAVQAIAAGIPPHTDMNPILLKPQTDVGAQVIIHGQVFNTMNAEAYHGYKQRAMQAVLDSYARLRAQYDVIVVEGAGSPAEINLRENDIANMGFAEAVDCPVILVGDIDRGGVFAQLVGTLALISERDAARIQGFIINRFRGDINLLTSGLDWLTAHTHKPVLGVLPYLHDLHLEAEDALNQGQQRDHSKANLKVVVPVLPRISNHTDFDPLRQHPQVDFNFVRIDQTIPAADLIILPGSKSVADDLAFLRENGWVEQIKQHLRYGGKVIGICGGLQMLGQSILDPEGFESAHQCAAGLGLLEINSTMAGEKRLKNVSGDFNGAPIHGYEIHIGNTTGAGLLNPAFCIEGKPEGLISPDQQILATYLHGIFESKAGCQALLEWAGLTEAEGIDYAAVREQGIDQLADAVAQHLDRDELAKLIPEIK